jgi:hypothetical protein
MIEIIKNIFQFISVIIFGISFRPIPKPFGLNCFFNQPTLGTIEEQVRDINQLDCHDLRVMFDWNDDVQEMPTDEIFWGFYDDIVNKTKDHCQILIVLTGCPTWNRFAPSSEVARQKYLDYIKLVVDRYSDFSHVIGFQIGNEPNSRHFPENKIYNFLDPLEYANFLILASKHIREISPKKLVINAATTSIIQNYPQTLDYNRALISADILQHVDFFAFHYYGTGFFNFHRPNGIKNFLRSIDIPLVCTEIGHPEPEVANYYAQTTLPYLLENVPHILDFYWYQYDGGGETGSYGLRNSITKKKSPLYNTLKILSNIIDINHLVSKLS